MSNKTVMKPLAVALGATFITTLAGTSIANAAANPFGMTELSSGYMVAAGDHDHDGDTKAKKEGKCGEGKCGEGKCGGKKAAADGGDKKMKKEGKCGEGKCGGKKAAGDGDGDHKMKKEGKCGEGKCGGKK